MRWGVRMNGADEDLPKSELVGSRLDKLRSIQEANKSVRRPFQFTLSQFFVATLVLALAWTVFPVRFYLLRSQSQSLAHLSLPTAPGNGICGSALRWLGFSLFWRQRPFGDGS